MRHIKKKSDTYFHEMIDGKKTDTNSASVFFFFLKDIQ